VSGDQGGVDVNSALRHFTNRHTGLAQQVAEFYDLLAEDLDGMLPNGAEKSFALRQLLVSKDAAVRAAYDAMEGFGG
jgi:hypothetical protein